MFDSPLDEVISSLFESYTESIGHISDTARPDDTFITVKTPATLYDNLTASEAHHEMEKIARVFAKFIDKHLYDQLIEHQTTYYPASKPWTTKGHKILEDLESTPSFVYYPLKLYGQLHKDVIKKVSIADKNKLEWISNDTYLENDHICFTGSLVLNYHNLAIQYIGDDIITKYKITHDADNYTMQFKVTFPENCKIHIITNVS